MLLELEWWKKGVGEGIEVGAR